MSIRLQKKRRRRRRRTSRTSEEDGSASDDGFEDASLVIGQAREIGLGGFDGTARGMDVGDSWFLVDRTFWYGRRREEVSPGSESRVVEGGGRLRG
jgi:hypothetical protein